MAENIAVNFSFRTIVRIEKTIVLEVHMHSRSLTILGLFLGGILGFILAGDIYKLTPFNLEESQLLSTIIFAAVSCFLVRSRYDGILLAWRSKLAVRALIVSSIFWIISAAIIMWVSESYDGKFLHDLHYGKYPSKVMLLPPILTSIFYIAYIKLINTNVYHAAREKPDSKV